jgi:hypothetical protein
VIRVRSMALVFIRAPSSVKHEEGDFGP